MYANSIVRMEKKVVVNKLKKSIDRTFLNVFLYALMAEVLNKGLTAGYSLLSGHSEYMTKDFGFILMIAFAAPVIFILYRGVRYENLDLKEKLAGESNMTVGRLILMLTLLLGVGIASSLITSIGEYTVSRFGLTVMNDSEWAKGESITTVSLIIYGTIVGPIAEELMFRGYVLGKLKKHGEFFAIVASALIFGAFHGNVIQLVHAGLAGIIYGFVASRYGVKWSIALHIFNNGIWGQGMTALIILTKSEVLGLIHTLLPIFAFFISIIYLFLNRKKVAGYIKRNKSNASLFYAVTSVWCIAVVILRFM